MPLSLSNFKIFVGCKKGLERGISHQQPASGRGGAAADWVEAPEADLVEAFGGVVMVAADVVEVVCVVEAELEEGGGKCKVRTTRLVGRRAG